MNDPGRRPVPTRRALTVVALAAPLALAGCTSGGSSQPAAASSSASAPSDAGGTLQGQFVQVISRVLPSVVEIRTPVGLGSGIIFDDEGDIVTNDHVVGKADQFQVSFSGGATPRAATLVGTYPPDDLAVIKVNDAGNLKPATFADSSTVKVGTIVLAMGNPLGLASSVTEGIVSAVGRTVAEPQSGDSPGATLPDVIQTSAAINPGNSGGALVDLDGQVIGIPTLAATDPQLGGGAAPGIGFAISSNIVKDIAGQLVKYDGQVKNTHRAELGIIATTVVDAQGHPAGVGVVNVVTGGPAAGAGIQAGDIIISVAGTDVSTTQQLTAVLANQDVGAKVPVGYLRGGNKTTVQVTLGELPGS